MKYRIDLKKNLATIIIDDKEDNHIEKYKTLEQSLINQGFLIRKEYDNYITIDIDEVGSIATPYAITVNLSGGSIAKAYDTIKSSTRSNEI